METVLHTCPVCGTCHEIPIGLHRLAYGRQLSCSARCKTLFPRQLLARLQAETAERRRALAAREEND